jgi:hypothetical protein
MKVYEILSVCFKSYKSFLYYAKSAATFDTLCYMVNI